MKFSKYLLLTAALFTSFSQSFAGEPARTMHYTPEGDGAVCVNGNRLYNRALYGGRGGFRMECSDVPTFGLYLPGMGGHLEIGMLPGDCTAKYTPGRMDYSQGGVTVEAQVLRSQDVALWKVTNTTNGSISLPVTFGGCSEKKFSRNGDLGVDPADCFDLKPAYCADNVFTIKGDTVMVEYGTKSRHHVSLIIPASKSLIEEGNVYRGILALKPHQSKIIAYFPTEKPLDEPLDELLRKAEKERSELASGFTIDTPDEWLNPIGGALSVAADAIWSGEAWLHGSIGWRTPHLGWRGAYAGDALGWYERSSKHLRTYADNQITDIPATLDHPQQDSTLNLARAVKRWGTPMYSDGYICRRPGKKDEMSHYDMNLVYADAMLRHFLHTNDKAEMRRLFPVLKRHLDWEKRNFDPDGDGLYDAYCCIWASDALYYSGGAVTHSSAYNSFANKLAAQVAKVIGEDPTPYLAEAEKIDNAIASTLWMPDKGVWAEFKDFGGEQRLHPYPALWTIYHAIDSELGDPFKRYAATVYVDREIPRIPLVCAPDSTVKPGELFTLSTTNWKPYSWSINNVAIAEVMHTALAYWQAGRPNEAYKLMKSVAIDNMYSGASPLNFGQISQYDAARGECYRDFADPIGVWSRALTEGLYGIRPDLLRTGSVVVVPGFPSDWDHASVSHPDISYSFERQKVGNGVNDIYVIESKYPKSTKIRLQVPASGLENVTVNGKKAKWHVVENSIDEPRIEIELGGNKKQTVSLLRPHANDTITLSLTGNERIVGPTKFIEVFEESPSAKNLVFWLPQAVDSSDSSDFSDFSDIIPSFCEPIPVPFNTSLSEIFKQKYLSPRPPVTTLQLPTQGIGEWCHPQLTADIDDSGIRSLAADNQGIVSLLEIPFATPAKGENILFTSLWDNYPTSASVPLSGKASNLYLLMAGTTNHMQWGMTNATLTVRYADGTADTLPLVNPINWAPIEQDFFTDNYAFRQPDGGQPPLRVGLKSGKVNRYLADCEELAEDEVRSPKGPMERAIDGGAAILLDMPVNPEKELAELTLTTDSQDVIVGLMAVTAQRPGVLTDWYREENINKPFVRWWWHGSAVDPQGLTYNLSEFADKGIGGVEITPIYGVKKNEANDIPYLSDKWMEMLGHTVSEAQRLGLQVDMNNGTGWPFGGPEVTPAESAQKLVTEKFEAPAGAEFSMEIKQPEKQPDATLQYIVAFNGGQGTDITSSLQGRSLKWEAPEGDKPWDVYLVWCGRTNQKVKRAAPGGEGLVINHYDSVAVRKYLDRFDRAFLGREQMLPTSFFNDSYEVYGADWSEKLPEEFFKDHGYRVELFINELVGDNGENQLRAKVLHDYRRTLGRMLEENFLHVWLDWAHGHGATVRNQSHGSPANILDLYASVDIPECESFGQTDFDIPGLHPTGPKRPSDSAPSVLKFASSAAHLTGKPLVSSETLTWLTEHFHTSLAHCKPELDQMFASGVNHVYFHGAPYSPKGVDFPGWLFYASINVSPTAALWENSSELFRYISRVQSFMTKGKPDNDILLYFPYDDVLTRTGGKPYMMFDIHKMQRVMPDVKNGIDDIVKAGYDVDYISDRLLENIFVDANGLLATEAGNTYRTLIVPVVEVMPEESLEKIRSLQATGAKVIFSSDIKATADSINLPTLEPLRRQGLSVARRTNEAGGHNYFISLLKDAEIDGWQPLGVAAEDVMIFDPLTGRKGKAMSRTAANGNVEVFLQLRPGESLLLKTFPEKVEAESWGYVKRGKAQEIKGKWQLSFPESDPEITETFTLNSPEDWTTLPDERLRVNRGKGLYTNEFMLKNPATAADWELDLGDVRESARVRINGQDAGIAWSVPMKLRVGRLLKPGKNTIEIEVTNLEANRIADFERRGVEWKIFKDANIATVTNAKTLDFDKWPVMPSGLLAPVRLIPLMHRRSPER